MKIKSMLIASAASLLTVTGGAQAADAIVAVDPEPVEYVRICDMYGAGFFYIPGTEVCLDISGGVSVEFEYIDNVAGVANTSIFRQNVDLNVNFDARHETDIGTVRSFISLEGDAISQDSAGAPTALRVDEAFISIQPNESFTVTMGLMPSLVLDQRFGIKAEYAANGFSAGIGYESVGQIIDATGLNNIGDAITAQVGYSGGMFSINAAMAFELGDEVVLGVNDDDAFYGFVKGTLTYDPVTFALTYYYTNDVIRSAFDDIEGAFHNQELEAKIDVKASDKLTLGAEFSYLFDGIGAIDEGFVIETTATYAVSSNFSIVGEIDYATDEVLAGTEGSIVVGLDFIATF